MTKDLNTLLSALYVLVDDHVVPPRTGRGRRPLLSDSELITLAVAQVLLRHHSERRWVRHIRSSAQWRDMFRYLPTQSGYHKRLKKAYPLFCTAILTLAQGVRPGSTTCGSPMPPHCPVACPEKRSSGRS